MLNRIILLRQRGPDVPFDIKEFPARIVGRPFGEYSPYGFGGAFWYTKVGYSF